MPTVDEVLSQLWTVHQQGHVAAAERGYRTLLEKVPRNANAWVYLGIALFDLHRFEEAADAYRQALALQQRFPIAWNNLGNALRMGGHVKEADDAFETALSQKPGYASALKNRGTLWIWAGEVDRGLHWYDQAMREHPDDPELHRNLGVIYLLQGRFDEGWKEYRYRWKMPGLARPQLPRPTWTGEPLDGKNIFVYPEQGLGDAIQFVRCIEGLQSQGAHVVFGCEPKLVPLFSGVRSIGTIVPLGGQIGPVDYHASLVEVIDYTWRGLDKIDGSPYLSVPDNLIEYWRKRLGAIPGKRVGICWQGNRAHHADAYRSIPLEKFKPLSDVEGVSLVSLQFGEGSDQLDSVDFGERVVRLPSDLDQSGGAFLDTAAVMLNLDLVITIDTSCGHLAGALGVPTWTLLGRVPDWRWGLEGDSTPWYANHRLWRQQQTGHWDEVLSRVAAALEQFREATSTPVR